VAEEAALASHGTSIPVERERILVKLSLPRDALIEFEVRCSLNLRVELAVPGIGPLPQRRATGWRHMRR
jgi:hypothetical protein